MVYFKKSLKILNLLENVDVFSSCKSFSENLPILFVSFFNSQLLSNNGYVV